VHLKNVATNYFLFKTQVYAISVPCTIILKPQIVFVIGSASSFSVMSLALLNILHVGGRWLHLVQLGFCANLPHINIWDLRFDVENEHQHQHMLQQLHHPSKDEGMQGL
jgi:hypothetical protein